MTDTPEPEYWNGGGGPTDANADPQPKDINPDDVPEGFEYHG